MATTDFALKGARVHRTTCKRAEGSPTLKDSRPEDIANATIASCCKPKAAQVWIDEAIESVNKPEPTAADIVSGFQEALVELGPPEPAGSFTAELPAEESFGRAALEDEDLIGDDFEDGGPLADAQAAQEYLDATAVSLSARYDGTGAAGYHWAGFGRESGRLVAETLGVAVKADNPNRQLVLTGDVERVDMVVALLTHMWIDGYKAFKAWRKTSAEYKALPEMGAQWTKSARYQVELAWLDSFGRGVASHWADGDLPDPMAPSFAAGRDWAAGR